MTTTINIKSNSKQIQKQLGRKYKKHLPEATRWALNNTAKKLNRTYKKQAVKTLDRPVPFTLRGFKIGFASKRKLESFVVVTDAVAKYLKFQVEGGIARPTKPEAVPTENQSLNKYGNIARKKLVGNNMEVRPTKTGMGIWKIYKKKPPVLLVAFKKTINYKKRFPFYKIGNGVVKSNFPKELRFSLRREFAKK